MAIDLRQAQRYQRIETIRRKPLEPQDYCAKWIPKYYGKQPGEWGYRAACVREIQRVTELDDRTIENWGRDFAKCPKYVHVMLRMADIINQMRDLAGLPPNFPLE
ncbi:hypothetical protein [Phormidium nigroviride]